jgi:hypothetical protein
MGFCARTVGFVALCAAISGAARAEQFHMPFDCQFDGARVRLRPSEDRAYNLAGPRARQIYTACSPSNPDRCRSWFVHRFDFYCGGTRVSWLEAAVAASRYAGRTAWIEDGRLHMRMGAGWEQRRGGRWGAFGRRRALDRDFGPDEGDPYGDAEDFTPQSERVVKLPPGFAPELGVPLTFDGPPSSDVAEDAAEPAYGDDRYAEAPRNDELADDAPPSEARRQDAPRVAGAPAVAIPALPERAPRREQRVAVASPPPPAAKPAAPAVPAPLPATSAANESAKPIRDVSPPKPSEVKPADGPSAPAGTNAAPMIINAPSAAAPQPATEPVPAPSAPAEAEIVAAQSETAAPESTSSVTPALAPTARFALESPQLQTTIIAAAATLLALTGFAGFGLWRWKRKPAPAPGVRDYASISLGTGGSGRQLAMVKSGTPDPHALPTPKLEGTGSGGGEPRMPQTYEEALEVLGASPDASLEAIKKIVDGLRQSWHPDLAKSAEDRTHREMRARQINVAWDLVSQHRTAA